MKLNYLLLLCGIALLHIYCDTDPGLKPVNSNIRGVIYFEGTWPEETDIVQVIATTKFPPTGTQDLIMGDVIPFGVDSIEYVLWLPPAEYQAIGVVWKEKNQAWNVVNILGMYLSSPADFLPGKVRLENSDFSADSINIYCKFSRAKKYVESSINGTIRVKGDWPPTAQTMLVGASVPILPSSLLDIYLSAPLPTGGDSTRYSISVPVGTYHLIGAIILEQGSDFSFDNIAYFKKKPSDFLPASVTVPTDTSNVTGIDIEINFTNH